jgi:hypothetical protein
VDAEDSLNPISMGFIVVKISPDQSPICMDREHLHFIYRGFSPGFASLQREDHLSSKDRYQRAPSLNPEE